jgi:hypothetical protein
MIFKTIVCQDRLGTNTRKLTLLSKGHVEVADRTDARKIRTRVDRQGQASCSRNTPLFSVFPYVCLEPVLADTRFCKYKMAQQRCFRTRRRDAAEDDVSEAVACLLPAVPQLNHRVNTGRVHVDTSRGHDRKHELGGRTCMQKTPFVSALSYVCPEPVLINVRFQV